MTVLPVGRSIAALLMVLVIAVAGCSSKPAQPPGPPGPQSGSSALPPGVEQLYADAKSDMASGAWDSAIKTLERVEGRAAGTLLAQQAQLDLAYAYWRSGERAQALAAIERFIKLNPSSPALDYALYLRGVINFNDDIGVMGSLAGQDLAERDSRASRDAYQAFKQLLTQFPESPYSEDARLRMGYILNTLADYELYVARYYFRRGAYVAAVNRAQQAVIDFEGAPATEEALYIMVLSYDRLGLETLRDDANRVFVKNFPDSKLPSEGLRRAGKAWWHIWN
jgi:outer membrane protein assembly factor BamD